MRLTQLVTYLMPVDDLVYEIIEEARTGPPDFAAIRTAMPGYSELTLEQSLDRLASAWHIHCDDGRWRVKDRTWRLPRRVETDEGERT